MRYPFALATGKTDRDGQETDLSGLAKGSIIRKRCASGLRDNRINQFRLFRNISLKWVRGTCFSMERLELAEAQEIGKAFCDWFVSANQRYNTMSSLSLKTFIDHARYFPLWSALAFPRRRSFDE